jgi:polysaccharide biosynthesis/export protein
MYFLYYYDKCYFLYVFFKMLLKEQLSFFIKKVFLYLLLISMVSCATAPGMRMNASDFDISSKSDKNQNLKPILKPITSQLIVADKLEAKQIITPNIKPFQKKDGMYQIEAGDVLAITVWDHPEISTKEMFSVSVVSLLEEDRATTPGFVVDQMGCIQFAYVGSVKVSGMTTSEARGMLTKKLSRFLKSPKVYVRINAYRSKRVYVEGEVKMPGTLSIDNVPMTLLEAINRAGGFLFTADQNLVRIIRQGKTYPISIPQLVNAGINPSSIFLKNGDLVRVLSREESRVFVLGEVTVPRPVYMRNGALMLSEALSEVGGLNPYYSNAHQVYVIRNASETTPIVYHLDAKSPVSMALATEFMLKPRDVIYIDAAPLAVWNRLLNLILPSANTVINTVINPLSAPQ